MACVGGPLEAVGALRQAALQELDVADDDGEQVVEVVRDAAGELADGLHLLGLPQGLLGLQALGDLLRDPLLQGLVQALELLGGLLGLLAGQEQLALVLAPVRGVEEGDAMNHRAASRIPLLDRVGQNRQGPSIGAGQIERDLVHEALHPQERREVGVVEDPGADAQKILEALVADEVLPLHADPGEEGLVGPDDGAVRQGREVAAGGAFVEFLSRLDQRPWSIFTMRRP